MDNNEINAAMDNIQSADFIDVIGDLATGILHLSEEEFNRQYEIYKLRKRNYPLATAFMIEQFFIAARTAKSNPAAVEQIEREGRQ